MVIDVLYSFINWIIDNLSGGITFLIGFLPQSPVSKWTNDLPNNVLIGNITWFIPFPTMLGHFAFLLVAIGIYYIIRVVARWLKVARG